MFQNVNALENAMCFVKRLLDTIPSQEYRICTSFAINF